MRPKIRFGMTDIKLFKIFEKYGIKFYGFTPNVDWKKKGLDIRLWLMRGLEIQYWLDNLTKMLQSL